MPISLIDTEKREGKAQACEIACLRQLRAWSMFVADMPALNRRSHRLRDFSLYILIAVAVAGFAILLGVHSAKTGQQPDVTFKWAGFALNTLFVFGSSLRAVRPFLKRPKLWDGRRFPAPAWNHWSIGHLSGRPHSLDLVRAC